MIKSIRDDLADASDALEHLVKKLPTLTLSEQVDVAARVKAIGKHAEKVDEFVKANIKAKRKGKEGYVFGELFKAFMKLVPTTRLDQTKLKVEYPEVHTACLKNDTDERVSFEVR